MHQRKVPTPPSPASAATQRREKTPPKANKGAKNVNSSTASAFGNKSGGRRRDTFITRLCGSITVLFTVIFLFIGVLIIIFHFNEDFGAAVTETLVKKMMPRVNATVVTGHLHFGGDVTEEDESLSENERNDPDFLSEHHRSKLTHKSTKALLTAALDHLDAIEVEGIADFETMHVLQDSHEGIAAEWKQRVADGNLMCELLGRILEAHQIIGAATAQNIKHDNEDALNLVKQLCIQQQPSSEDEPPALRWRATHQAYRHYYFHRPSVTKYGAHQWLWDSCFHIMAQVGFWRATISSNVPTKGHDLQTSNIHFKHIATKPKVELKFKEVADASDATSPPPIFRHSALYRLIGAILEFRSLFAFQNLETGFVPEMTYWHPDPNQYSVAGHLFGYGDRGRRFTDITQMPMLSFPLQRIVKALKDLEKEVDEKTQKREEINTETSANNNPHRSISRLALAYFAPKVALYFSFWQTYRKRDGLVSIFHPWESGLDASPMYDPFHGFCANELETEARRQEKVRDNNGNAETSLDDPPTEPKRSSKQPTADGRCWYSSYISIIDPSSAGCPPHPEDLYPKFISLLYRYKHANGWDFRKIASSQLNRFEVQDVGVNAVLGYNMKLVLSLLDNEVLSANGKRFDPNARGSSNTNHEESSDRGGQSKKHSSITTTPRRPHFHDRFHDFMRDEILLASYDELFSVPSEEDADLKNTYASALQHPIALTHTDADAFISSILDQCVAVKAANSEDHPQRVSIISKGWSPKAQRFIDSDATRVVQQMMLLLFTSSTVVADVDSASPIHSKLVAVAGHIVSELSDTNRFGFSHSELNSNANISFSYLLKSLQRDLRRYARDAPSSCDLSDGKGQTTILWGVPTTAVNDLAFEPEDSPLMWRGPSWPTTNWFTIEGLDLLSQQLLEREKIFRSKGVKDGDTTLSSASVNAIKTRLLRVWTLMVHTNGFSEYYNPLSGEPLGQRGLGMSLSLIDALWGK